MPRLRRKNLSQRDWTDSHKLQLQSGHDWFNDAFTDITDCPLAERDKWPSGNVRAEMGAAWEDLRDEMLDEAEAAGKVPPWAAYVFDDGLSGREAKRQRDADIQARHPNIKNVNVEYD
jgi:hypothetical protein